MKKVNLNIKYKYFLNQHYPTIDSKPINQVIRIDLVNNYFLINQPTNTINQEERKFLDNLQQKLTFCAKNSQISQKVFHNFGLSQNCLKKM
jgi:hypothetical protein